MNKHINHNLTHCCYTIDPKYTVLVHCTPHVQVSRKGVHVIILLLSVCLLEDLIIWSTINYMCDEALTPARFSCICHMREPFNEPFIVLFYNENRNLENHRQKPMVCHTSFTSCGSQHQIFWWTKYFAKLIKMHDLFLIYQGQMKVTIL